ncbi:MAG: SMP-30/gluconolactonase/LRE family protein [Acidimicrobiia bacterium]
MAFTTVVEGIKFPEGPRWYDGRLWFSDMHGRKVYALKPGGQPEVVTSLVGDMPSGLGFLPDGSLLVVARKARRILRVAPGSSTPEPFADLTGYPLDSLNDMVTGPDGRSYVGGRIERGYSPDSFEVEDGPGARTEVVIRVEPDGSSAIEADGLIGPNGSAITPDGRTLLVAESRGRKVTRFPLADDGTLGERDLFADTGEYYPDGLCLDAQGAVWVGAPMRQRFLRIVEGGEVTDVLETGDRWAIACVLGGDDRRTLYMMTAHNTLENLAALSEGATESTAVGFVEAVEVEVPGAGWP